MFGNKENNEASSYYITMSFHILYIYYTQFIGITHFHWSPVDCELWQNKGLVLALMVTVVSFFNKMKPKFLDHMI